ncbi:hypothetical protein MBLNU459_g5865t1 [Dothideomycetes sp. NU459]
MPGGSSDTLDQLKRVFRGWFRKDKRGAKILNHQRGLGRQISNGNATATAQAAATAAARLQAPSPAPPLPPKDAKTAISRPPSIPLLVAAQRESRPTSSAYASDLEVSQVSGVAVATPIVAGDGTAADQNRTPIQQVPAEKPTTEHSITDHPVAEEIKEEKLTVDGSAAAQPALEQFVFSNGEPADTAAAHQEETEEADISPRGQSDAEPHALTTENAASSAISEPPVHEDLLPNSVATVDSNVVPDDGSIIDEDTRRKDSSMAVWDKEEQPQAGHAARSAPAAFHDEKIPVFAEPPVIRTLIPAEGMVATSGPLEDFPFR